MLKCGQETDSINSILDLSLWNYEADMKQEENGGMTEVKIRPKTPKSNIYMEVSYLKEMQSLTNISEKARYFRCAFSSAFLRVSYHQTDALNV